MRGEGEVIFIDEIIRNDRLTIFFFRFSIINVFRSKRFNMDQVGFLVTRKMFDRDHL